MTKAQPIKTGVLNFFFVANLSMSFAKSCDPMSFNIKVSYTNKYKSILIGKFLVDFGDTRKIFCDP